MKNRLFILIFVFLLIGVLSFNLVTADYKFQDAQGKNIMTIYSNNGTVSINNLSTPVGGDFCLADGTTCLSKMNSQVSETDPKWSENYSNYLVTKNYALNDSRWSLNYSVYLTKPTWGQAMNKTLLQTNDAYNTTWARTNAANVFGNFNQTFDTNTFFIDAVSGRIGVGTTAPGLTFETSGTVGWPAASGTAQTGVLRVGPAGTNNVMDMGVVSSSAGAWIQSTSRANLATLAPLILNPNGGNVGIGTNESGRKLHVAGGGTTTGSVLVTDGFFEVDGVNTNSNVSGGTENLRIGWPTTSRVAFNLQGTEVMTMLPSGNVGIGTTSPNQKLDVAGSLNFENKLLEDGNEILSGMIVAFSGACPTGWTEYTNARGRVIVGTPSGGTNAGTVGTSLTNLANIVITTVPSHLHAVDPPATTSGGVSADHSHAVDPPATTSGNPSANHYHAVDPPATASGGISANHQHAVTGSTYGGAGSHQHYVKDFAQDSQAGGGFWAISYYGGVSQPTSWAGAHEHSISFWSGYVSSDHAHTTNIGSFNTGTVSAWHTHDTNIASFSSGGASVGHTHATDIASFNSASTGSASVDVSMPYIQLTYCQKTAGSDIAEWVPSNDYLEPATILSVDPSNEEKVIASRKEYDSSAVGVVSTQPGWIIGNEAKSAVQMALAGRVPVRVTLKNGKIGIGDSITTSSIAGVGMKSTREGPIIGKSMQEINENSSLIDCVDSTTGKVEKCGTILMLLSISWWKPLDENKYSMKNWEEVVLQIENLNKEIDILNEENYALKFKNFEIEERLSLLESKLK